MGQISSDSPPDSQNARDKSRSWCPLRGGPTQMPGITMHCVSLQRSSQSAPQGGLREEHSIRGPAHTLMSTQMHTADQGRKAPSLLIELLLFALIEDYGIKSCLCFSSTRSANNRFALCTSGGLECFLNPWVCGVTRELVLVISTRTQGT